jgi:histidine triad (HIT) family protein
MIFSQEGWCCKVKSDDSCIFCKIVKGQIPASMVYEDENVMVFLDIRPLSTGHTLVIPKEHFVDLFDIPQEALNHVQAATKQVAKAVKQATAADGISIIQQNGKAAGQDIFHFHAHIVPRFEGEKLPHFSELKMAERAALDEMAKKIKQELK